jgi:L-iditol 2-dehydrogenase
VVIVTAGAVSAFEQALQAVERGGSVLFFAPTRENVTIPLSINDVFWRKDITLTTTYGGSPADCVTALEFICAKRIPLHDMITHRFGLQKTVQGFRLVEKGDESIKVIIRPQE